MVGSLIRAAAYAKAPRAAFAVRHPGKAFRIKKLQWQFRHTEAPRWAATVGAVGAVALVLPLGLVLGRRRSVMHHTV
jgi:hypothetical protein